MSRKKVTVVGGGFVGSTTAQRIVDLELGDVVLTDILDGPPAGKALDMVESGPITRTDSHAVGISTATGDYSATAGSDVVVITAGFPRKPGMSRDDLLKANYDVVKAVAAQAEIGRHTSELQSLAYLVCRLLLEKKKKNDSHIGSGRHLVGCL